MFYVMNEISAMNDVRWKQRFQNFEKAFLLLQEIVESKDNLSEFTAIVQEGIIQRFEYTFELAWKTLKDKMEADGLSLERLSPKYIFKDAYKSKYIDTVEVWIEMTNDRNLMSHTYDSVKLPEMLQNIKALYYPEIQKLYDYFKHEVYGYGNL